MLKSIIDQLRAHRDRLDAAIAQLETVDEDESIIDVPAHLRTPVRRRVEPIVLGARARALTSGASASRPICGRPGCGKVLGPNNNSGYCGSHWYETLRKKPLPVGHQTTSKRRGRPGPRSAEERRAMSLRAKQMWKDGAWNNRKQPKKS